MLWESREASVVLGGQTGGPVYETLQEGRIQEVERRVRTPGKG